MSQSRDLMVAFGVSRDDVIANAEGRLAHSQARRLRRLALVNGALSVVVTAGLSGLILGVAERPLAWWQWLIVLGLAAALLVVGGRWVARLWLAAGERVVVRHTGTVEVAHAGRRGRQLLVDGRVYRLPVPLRLVVPGSAYDVYVVERIAAVVALVPIDDT